MGPLIGGFPLEGKPPPPKFPNGPPKNHTITALLRGNISVVRGRNMQFQVYGDPHYPNRNFSFTPRPMFGSRHPKHSGKICYGVDLRDLPARDTSFYLKGELNLCYLVEAYNNYPYKRKFFLKGGFLIDLQVVISSKSR